MHKAYSHSGMNVPVKPPIGFEIQDEELEPAVKEIGPMCDNERQRSFDWYYDVGTLAREHYQRVQQDREGRGCSMYGEHFYERLAESLDRPGIHAGLLCDCVRLVQNVSPGEYAELSQHAEISPTHARMLGSILEPQDRATLKAKVINEQLTTKQLHAAILELYGFRRKPGAGRKPMVPKNVHGALRHLACQAEKFCSLNENWFGDRFDLPSEIAGLPNDKCNEQLQTQLEDALNHCRKLRETAAADEEHLVTMLREVESRMAAQAEYNARLAEEEKKLEQEAREEKEARLPGPSRQRTPTQDRRIGRELHAL